MKSIKLLPFVVSAAFSFHATSVLAGTFIGADGNNTDLILHPSNYVPGNNELDVRLCISPNSAVTTGMEISVQNVVATYNALQATTNNLQTGANNNIPSGQLDAESVLLHETGHCIGLAHVNLASESGLSGSDREYTKSTTGANNNFNLNNGADNINGSADDIRGDDVNLHWFKMVDNNPFTLAGVIDASTYSVNLNDLPSGSFAANGSRALAPQLGVPGTEAVMQQGQGVDEAQRTLTADGVATVSFGASGVDEVAGTNDDYNLNLIYQGITNSNCDITIVVNSSTSFASCSVGFQGISGDHFRVSSATVRLNDTVNWFYNQVPVDPFNIAPVFDPLTDATTNENTPVSFALNASDPDVDDTLSFSAPGAPAFCSLLDFSDGTGALDCLPQVGDAGVYLIEIRVTDDGDPPLSASQFVTLEVLPEGITVVTQCRTPFLSIGDLDPAGLLDTMTIDTPGVIQDVDVSFQLGHERVGDLGLSLARPGLATIVLIDRPGFPATIDGCTSQDIVASFDDEGVDGVAENVCNPTSPALSGSLVPNTALSQYDGELLNGQWNLIIRDDIPGATGFLAEWCVTAQVTEVMIPDTDSDGVLDDSDNCTLVANSDQIDSNADGLGNVCDADFDNNCVVNFLDISAFAGAFNTTVGDPNYDPDIEVTGDGLINFLDLIVVRDSFLMAPGPSANECVVGLGN